jgi:hypothetical protein
VTWLDPVLSKNAEYNVYSNARYLPFLPVLTTLSAVNIFRAANEVARTASQAYKNGFCETRPT